MEHRASNCNALVTTHYFSLLEGTKVEAMIQAHENEISLDSGKSGELLNWKRPNLSSTVCTVMFSMTSLSIKEV